MDRRDFLTVFGQTSLASVVILGTPKFLRAKAPEQIEFKGMLFKRMENGKIHFSIDNGVTWDVTVNFGADRRIQRLYSNRQYIYAQINHQGYTFTLRSIDGKKWRSISTSFIR